jgi:hypothetical protein
MPNYVDSAEASGWFLPVHVNRDKEPSICGKLFRIAKIRTKKWTAKQLSTKRHSTLAFALSFAGSPSLLRPKLRSGCDWVLLQDASQYRFYSMCISAAK